VVPAGKFTMGLPYQQEWMPEGPQHEVTIENAFAVGKYVVTFAEWDMCVAAGACPRVCDRIAYSVRSGAVRRSKRQPPADDERNERRWRAMLAAQGSF
jgi:formylglycine-generating enzyme required for sulfatase activity